MKNIDFFVGEKNASLTSAPTAQALAPLAPKLSTELSTAFVDCPRAYQRACPNGFLQGFTGDEKSVKWRASRVYPSTDMKFSALSYLPTLPPLSTSLSVNAPPTTGLPVRVALWLLDRPRLGQAVRVKQFAGRLLKQPARQGVVLAQSRLGQMLCRDCGNPRDRRIGLELLRQAARAGHRPAQLELAQLGRQPWALSILATLKN